MLKKTLWVVILFVTCAKADQYSCKNPNDKQGYCYSLYECPSLYELTGRANLTNSEILFVRQSKCENGYGRSPFLCCTADTDFVSNVTINSTIQRPPFTHTQKPSTTPSNDDGSVLPLQPNCGKPFKDNRIFGGSDAAIDAFTWMVLLEYVNKLGKRSLECGGNLINHRYVLTAAHCVKGMIEHKAGRLTTVRLGEYIISTKVDCVGDDCNQPIVEVGIEQTIVHPEFNPLSKNLVNDIALLRLATHVEYTEFISPVCLPFANINKAIETNDRLIVSGWGHTMMRSQSDIKKQVEVPVYDQDECVWKFQNINITLTSSQLCAGGEYRKDSCSGDSGGPLMRQSTQSFWYIEGVVSSGHSCGLENWPAIYTRVADYIDWVQSNIHA